MPHSPTPHSRAQPEHVPNSASGLFWTRISLALLLDGMGGVPALLREERQPDSHGSLLAMADRAVEEMEQQWNRRPRNRFHGEFGDMLVLRPCKWSQTKLHIMEHLPTDPDPEWALPEPPDWVSFCGGADYVIVMKAFAYLGQAPEVAHPALPQAVIAHALPVRRRYCLGRDRWDDCATPPRSRPARACLCCVPILRPDEAVTTPFSEVLVSTPPFLSPQDLVRVPNSPLLRALAWLNTSRSAPAVKLRAAVDNFEHAAGHGLHPRSGPPD